MRSALPESCLDDLHRVSLKLAGGDPADMGAAFSTIDVELGHILEHYCRERGVEHRDAQGRSYSLPGLLESLSDCIPGELQARLKRFHSMRNVYVHDRGATPRPGPTDVRSYFEAVRTVTDLLYGADGLWVVDHGLGVPGS